MYRDSAINMQHFKKGWFIWRSVDNRASLPKMKQTKAESYRHPEADSPLRPEIGTQPKFKKKKPPVTYRYDSSLSPALEWDGQNGTRDLADFLLGCIKDTARLPAPHVFDAPRELKLNDGTTRATVRGLEDAVDQLAALGKPFLNWAGKAERLSFDVPTLPLFVHERLSTAAIIDTLKSHRKPADVQLDLFGDPQHPIASSFAHTSTATSGSTAWSSETPWWS
jgi:adenine-specific DNA-methyltransferase